MIKDLTISYVEGGIKTTMTVKDDCYSNMPYNDETKHLIGTTDDCP